MSEQCECRKCIEELGLKGPQIGHDFFDELPLSAKKMIVCPECGNKRCPRASDHRLACTGSNDPGQAGSVYA
jgi:uncharacterized Zn-finger protein